MKFSLQVSKEDSIAKSFACQLCYDTLTLI